MAPADKRADALAKLRASARNVDGELRPDFLRVANEVGMSHMTLRRWWAAAMASPEGEVIERAAAVVQGEVEVSMRDWMRGRFRQWRRMVDVVTSEAGVARIERLAEEDPEAAVRAVGMVGKILEAAPVVARLADDGGPAGGTAGLERLRSRLMNMSDGRALLTAK